MLVSLLSLFGMVFPLLFYIFDYSANDFSLYWLIKYGDEVASILLEQISGSNMLDKENILSPNVSLKLILYFSVRVSLTSLELKY